MSSVDLTENAKETKFIRKSPSVSSSSETSCTASSVVSDGGSVSVSVSESRELAAQDPIITGECSGNIVSVCTPV